MTLTDKAKAAGLKVNMRDGITRLRRGSVEIIVWQDGSMTRGDVRLDLALRMSARVAAKALGLS
jgi:hypothetical protein